MWASQFMDWSISHRDHQTRSTRKRVKDRRRVVTVWLHELQQSFPQKKYVTTEWEYTELISLVAPGCFLHPHHASVWSQWKRGRLSDQHINCFTPLPGLENHSHADASLPYKQPNMETHHFMPVLCKTSSNLCVFVCFWLTWFCFSFFLMAAKEQYHIPGDYVCLFVFHYVLDCPAFTEYSWSIQYTARQDSKTNNMGLISSDIWMFFCNPVLLV